MSSSSLFLCEKARDARVRNGRDYRGDTGANEVCVCVCVVLRVVLSCRMGIDGANIFVWVVLPRDDR